MHKSSCSFLLLFFFKKVLCLPLLQNSGAIFTRNFWEQHASWLICMATSVKWRRSTCQALLLRSSIAQRESDCWRSVQFALIMRQLDRDTTAVTLPGVRRDSLIRAGFIFQLNQRDVYHILIFFHFFFCDDSTELGEQLFQ